MLQESDDPRQASFVEKNMAVRRQLVAAQQVEKNKQKNLRMTFGEQGEKMFN